MNPVAWLCSLFSGRSNDPEVHELAHRVTDLEKDADEQDKRLSTVEARVGIRRPPRWQQRDAG